MVFGFFWIKIDWWIIYKTIMSFKDTFIYSLECSSFILGILIILFGGYISIFYTLTGFHLRVSCKKWFRKYGCCKSNTKLRYSDPNTYNTYDLTQIDNKLERKKVNVETSEKLPERRWEKLFKFEQKSNRFKKYGDNSLDLNIGPTMRRINYTDELLKITKDDLQCNNITNILEYWYNTALDYHFLLEFRKIKAEKKLIDIVDTTHRIDKECSISNIVTHLSNMNRFLEENNYKCKNKYPAYYEDLSKINKEFNPNSSFSFNNNETILEIGEELTE